MLSGIRRSWAPSMLLAFAVLSSALTIEEALHIDGIEAYLHHGVKRQASGTGSSPASSTPVPIPSSSQVEQPSSTLAPSSVPAVSTPASSNIPQTTAQRSSNAVATTAQDSATFANSPSSPLSTRAPESTRITTLVVRTTPLVRTSVQSFLTSFTTILSNGQTSVVTSTGESTYVQTTGVAVNTDLPTTQPGSSGGNSLSENNKKVIGGVVGGVGGAILLGGIAVVCWRIWGRKKRVTEDDADLMAGTGSALGEKPRNGDPFQTNLDQYHTPGQRPNAAANF